MGQVVRAIDLIGKEQQSDFTCLGCDNILIAKVNGKIKQPHFAHKSIQECTGETYLHRLGKQVFFEVYQKCLEENEPFYITFHVSKKCNKFKRSIRKNCDLGFIEKKFDLTEYFSIIEVEKKEENFIPDLLLSRANFPEENIYIEIAVTHSLFLQNMPMMKQMVPPELQSETRRFEAMLVQHWRSFIGQLAQESPKQLNDLDSCAGKTPLMLMAEKGDTELVTIMLKAGADPEMQSISGMTALHSAIKSGVDSCVDVLLDHPCKRDNLTDDGQSPLHTASWTANLHAVRRLLQLSPKLARQRNSQGMTPRERISYLIDNPEARSL